MFKPLLDVKCFIGLVPWKRWPDRHRHFRGFFNSQVIFGMKKGKDLKKNFDGKLRYQPAFGCCAPQTLVKICFFNIFNGKKLKKGEKAKNLLQNLAKYRVFKFAPKRWSSVLFPDWKSPSSNLQLFTCSKLSQSENVTLQNCLSCFCLSTFLCTSLFLSPQSLPLT